MAAHPFPVTRVVFFHQPDAAHENTRLKPAGLVGKLVNMFPFKSVEMVGVWCFVSAALWLT